MTASPKSPLASLFYATSSEKQAGNGNDNQLASLSPQGKDRLDGSMRVLTHQELAKLASPEITSLLGAPSFTMREGQYEIWRYQQNLCLMDIYLTKASNGSETVAFVSFRHDINRNPQFLQQSCWALKTS